MNDGTRMTRRQYVIRCYLAGAAVAGATYMVADVLAAWMAGGFA